MPVAFILVDTETGRIEEVLEKILDVEEVAEAYSVAGPYSIVAKVETESFEKLVKVIPEEIHSIPGIKRTMTLIAFGTPKEFRTDACDQALALAKSGQMNALYSLCRKCRQLKLCAYGARVVTFGF
ncbi:MAG: Lrp/AsnC ligand binding domain-containing protein [Candidatus Hadarchaeales archaeon]